MRCSAQLTSRISFGSTVRFHLLTYSGASTIMLGDTILRLWNRTQHYRRAYTRMFRAERRRQRALRPSAPSLCATQQRRRGRGAGPRESHPPHTARPGSAPGDLRCLTCSASRPTPHHTRKRKTRGRSSTMAIAIINPTTGQLEQEFSAHTPAEVEAKIAEAQAAFEALRGTTYDERGDLDAPGRRHVRGRGRCDRTDARPARWASRSRRRGPRCSSAQRTCASTRTTPSSSSPMSRCSDPSAVGASHAPIRATSRWASCWP